MVYSVRTYDVLDRTKLIELSLSCIVQGGRREHPYISRGEFHGGRPSAYWDNAEPSKWTGKRPNIFRYL